VCQADDINGWFCHKTDMFRSNLHVLCRLGALTWLHDVYAFSLAN